MTAFDLLGMQRTELGIGMAALGRYIRRCWQGERSLARAHRTAPGRLLGLLSALALVPYVCIVCQAFAAEPFRESRESLRRALLEDVLIARFEQRYPGLIEDVTDAVAAARRAGQPEEEALQAGHSVVLAKEFDLIMHSVRGIRLEFLDLTIDLLKAARSISTDACIAVLTDRGLSAKLVPMSLIDRRVELMVRALAIDPSPPQVITTEEFRRLLEPAYRQLPITDHLALALFNSGRGAPPELCDACIRYYGAIQSLPREDRDAAWVYSFFGPR